MALLPLFGANPFRKGPQVPALVRVLYADSRRAVEGVYIQLASFFLPGGSLHKQGPRRARLRGEPAFAALRSRLFFL
jgi:hypothetical protein